MILSKNFNDRNTDGKFKLILLIYGNKMRKNMYQNLCRILYGNSMKVNFTKNRFLEQVQKIELIN